MWSPLRFLEQLLIVSHGLNLLRRILHDEVTARRLNSVLVRIVVNNGMLATEVIPGRRGRDTPLQRGSLPGIVRRGLAFEPAVNQVVEKNQLYSACKQGGNSDEFVYGH